MNVKKFVEEEEIKGSEGLPDGDTFIEMSKTEVETFEDEYEGKVKTKYRLITKDKTYIVGVKVMRGIKSLVAKNPKLERVRITRTGEKLDTTYTVVAVLE